MITVGRTNQTFGFTLVELMSVIAILAILVSIAVPGYQGYIRDAQRVVLLQHISTMHIFQEDFRLLSGSYAEGVYDFTNPQAPVTSLADALGWQPGSAMDTSYVVSATTDSYTVTATKKNVTVTRTFP